MSYLPTPHTSLVLMSGSYLVVLVRDDGILRALPSSMPQSLDRFVGRWAYWEVVGSGSSSLEARPRTVGPLFFANPLCLLVTTI